jgi:AcrR family transcriptional regulator
MGAMTSQRSRLNLSRARVLRAGVRVADTRGLDALSMRTLAQAVRAKTMTLYGYVGGKDELLSGIVDLVVSEFPLPDPQADWKSAIRASLLGAHEVLLRHPWACSLMLSATPSHARVLYIEALLRTLRLGGFSATMTHHAYHILDSHLIGFTLWQTGYSAAPDLRKRAQTFVARSGDEFPYIAEHAKEHATTGKPAMSEFAFALDLVLKGLSELRRPEQ